jgi:hypothetical protein
MKEKKISFGNSYANLIQDNKFKKEILNYLFDRINLNDFRYHMLNSISKLKYLATNDHYILPNFSGKNYLLIFCKIRNIKYSVFIDRKKLKYKLDDIDLSEVLCINLDFKCNDNIFNGTIYDGKMLKDNDNNFTYLINDCFYLAGDSIIDVELFEKFKNIDNTISSKFHSVPSPCFNFKYNKLYNYRDLQKLIETDMKIFTFNPIGLIFSPKKSGISTIYIESKDPKVEIFSSAKEDNADLTLDCPSYNLIYNLKNILYERTYNYENGDKKKNFLMEKTATPDVYKLFEIASPSTSVGVACIPSMKLSHRFTDHYKNRSKSKVQCVFSNQHNKWVPLKALES